MGTYHLDLDNKNVKFVFYCLLLFSNAFLLFAIYVSNLVISTYYLNYRFDQLSQDIKNNSVETIINRGIYKKLFTDKEGVIRSLSTIESLINQRNPELALKNIENVPPPVKPLFASLKAKIEQDKSRIEDADSVIDAEVKSAVNTTLLNYAKPMIPPQNENAYRKFCGILRLNCL